MLHNNIGTFRYSRRSNRWSRYWLTIRKDDRIWPELKYSKSPVYSTKPNRKL